MQERPSGWTQSKFRSVTRELRSALTRHNRRWFTGLSAARSLAKSGATVAVFDSKTSGGALVPAMAAWS